METVKGKLVCVTQQKVHRFLPSFSAPVSVTLTPPSLSPSLSLRVSLYKLASSLCRFRSGALSTSADSGISAPAVSWRCQLSCLAAAQGWLWKGADSSQSGSTSAAGLKYLWEVAPVTPADACHVEKKKKKKERKKRKKRKENESYPE